jgi:hypothetical protein
MAVLVLVAACGAIILADRGEREDDDRQEGHRAARDSGAVTMPSAVVATTRPVSFAKDVQPILQDRCYRCHSAAKAKGGVKVDTRGGLQKLIRPGHAAESFLVRVLTTGQMPPRGDKVPAEAIGLIRGWIDQGAKWDQ